MPASSSDLFAEFYDFTDSDDRIQAAQFIELYQESGAFLDDSEADREQFFQFLNAFYPDVEPQSKEFWQDLREAFYELSGITPQDIDWELWREAIGYGRQ